MLPQPLQVPKRNSPSPAKLDTQRSIPDINPAPAEAAAPKAEAAPQAAAPVQVLTNNQVVQAPVEIKPAARAAIGPRTTALPDNLPPPGGFAGGQAAPGGSGAGAGGAPGGGGAAKAADNAPMDKPGGNYDAKGIRTGPHMLGCYTPEAYLTSAEKAACAQQMAEKGRKGLNLGLNIDPAKLADYDRNRACHANTVEAARGTSNGQSADTSIKGLGVNPRLRDCGPGDR